MELIRDGQTAEARETQRTEIVPLADQLERQTNQLVNIAEADMVAAIDATARTYQASRVIVIVFAVGSLLLALGLGYVISLSLISPVREIEKGLRRIAAGAFGQRVEVANRDELGELADSVNQTSEKLGKLYDEIETHRRDLPSSLQRQTATAEVLQVISRSTFDLPTVLDTLVGSAAKLCNAIYGGIFLRDGDRLVCGALYGGQREDVAQFQPMSSDRSTASGRVMISGRTEIVGDVFADADYDARWLKDTWTETRAIMSVPLLRDGKVEGVFTLCRPDINSFTAHHCALVQTFADQAVIAIENVRLFDEVRARTRELQRIARLSNRDQ